MTEEKEFRSKVEDLVDNVKELRFPSSAGFRPYQHFFCEEAVSPSLPLNIIAKLLAKIYIT